MNIPEFISGIVFTIIVEIALWAFIDFVRDYLRNNKKE